MAKSVAIIPARGGSKRIPRKNIKIFHGKPLIAYSIETALESKLFEKVIVSTDDEEIAEVAKKYGAEVPFLRPKELADDYTATQPVVDNVLEYLKNQAQEYDYYCTIYATAPLLQAKYLMEGIEKLKNSDAVNAFSATSMPFPIQRTFKLNKDGRCEMFTPEYYSIRSQDLEKAYQDAGQFYWTKINQKSDDIMFGKDSIPIILPRYLVQDIDTIEDWKQAELMYSVINQKDNIEFLGYQVKIIYDDYNYYQTVVQNIDDIEKTCLSLENQDQYYNISYRKKYKVNSEILYSKKETIQIENKNIPLKYRLTDTIHDKIEDIYNNQDINKEDIISIINDLNNLLDEIK